MLQLSPLSILGILSLSILLLSVSSIHAGGDGGCTGGAICRSGVKASLECATDGDCPGSTCEPIICFPDLLRRCEGGSGAGTNCTKDADCSGGRCRIQFQPSTPTIHTILTLIVHDEAINFLGACTRAATILLEVKQRGQQYLLPRSYLCIPQTLDADLEFVRTEAGLDTAANSLPASLLTRLLFQGEDVGTDNPQVGRHMSQALRNILGIPGGRAVIIETPTVLKPFDYTDSAASPIFEPGLGSVVRIKVDIKFVQE